MQHLYSGCTTCSHMLYLAGNIIMYNAHLNVIHAHNSSVQLLQSHVGRYSTTAAVMLMTSEASTAAELEAIVMLGAPTPLGLISTSSD